MSEADRTYIPAAGHDWLLPLYDLLVKLMGAESAHRQLIDQADLEPGQRILEIGCGTGNVTILVKTLYPAVEIVGLDPDRKALDRARRKADRQRVSIQLDRGFSDELQYPDESYDRVLSAFMFHHLTRDEKEQSLREIRRVLRPGGSLHLLDFGGAHDRSGGFIAHLLHRREHLRDNSANTILTLMRQASTTPGRWPINVQSSAASSTIMHLNRRDRRRALSNHRDAAAPRMNGEASDARRWAGR